MEFFLKPASFDFQKFGFYSAGPENPTFPEDLISLY